MCKQHKHHGKMIDKCMRKIVEFINSETRFETVMCCCGHWKYPSSLIVIDSRVHCKVKGVFGLKRFK